MINKSNDLPSFVKETNLPKIVDKLTDASNIKISNNKYGNRVQTVIDKIVEKADDVTKAIKQEVVNDSYSFKVGTGDVDVSSDVEDGFSEIGLKGVTYQNLFINCNNSNCFNNYIHWSVVAENTFEVIADGTNKYLFIKKANMLLKPSTQYTFIFDVLENTLVSGDEGDYVFTIFGSSGSIVGGVALTGNNVKTTVFLKTTVSDLDTAVHGFDSYLNNRAISGKLKVRLTMLEGDHTNNPNLPLYFKGIVGVGDKSKNLFNGKNVSIGYLTATGAINASGTTCRVTDYIEVKSNTSYTVNNPANETHCFYDSDKNFISYVGARTFITPVNCKYVRCTIKRADYDNTFQLEEGEISTQYEPYYDGHKIEILSNGKNLFKPDIVTDTKSYTLHTSNGYWGTVFKVKPNTDYKITSKSDGFNLTTIANSYVYFTGNGGGELWIVHQTSNPSGDSEGIVNSGSKGEIYIRMPQYTFPIIPYMLIHRKIQIEEETTDTTYTPYIEDKTQILLDEPLMRLPNGICDEITRDGKLIRRVGKVVMNKTTCTKVCFWLNVNASENYVRFYVYYKDIPNGNIGVNSSSNLNNRFPNLDNPYSAESETCKCVNNYIGVAIKVSEIPDFYNMNGTEKRNSILDWLEKNPITVYYELATPIITELPAPCLRIFKDGHLTFNTLVAPESNHVVQLNKSGQIQNAIKESQSLDNRINVLENNYDNLMLSTISRLNDLELNYKLK